MDSFFKVFRWITGLLLAMSTAFQCLALIGGVMFNEYNSFFASQPWLMATWIGMLVLLIVVYVMELTISNRFPWPPVMVFAAIIGAVAAFFVATTLRDLLPEHLNMAGRTQGLTTWRMIYRHMSSALVGVLLAFTSAVRWFIISRQRRIAAWDAAYRTQIGAINGIPADESTLGLDSYADEGNKPSRKKRRKK